MSYRDRDVENFSDDYFNQERKYRLEIIKLVKKFMIRFPQLCFVGFKWRRKANVKCK